MTDHFTSKRQKTSCLEAIADCRAHWQELLAMTKDSMPGVDAKTHAINRLRRKGYHFHRKPHPMHACFLCDFAFEETEKETKPQKAGAACRTFCPVIWTKDNPENTMEPGDQVPCTRNGSPYTSFISLCGTYGTDRKQMEDAIRDILVKLDDAEEKVKNIPVQKRKETP